MTIGTDEQVYSTVLNFLFSVFVCAGKTRLVILRLSRILFYVQTNLYKLNLQKKSHEVARKTFSSYLKLIGFVSEG